MPFDSKLTGIYNTVYNRARPRTIEFVHREILCRSEYLLSVFGDTMQNVDERDVSEVMYFLRHQKVLYDKARNLYSPSNEAIKENVATHKSNGCILFCCTYDIYALA